MQKTRGKLGKGLGKIILSDGDKYNTEILQFYENGPCKLNESYSFHFLYKYCSITTDNDGNRGKNPKKQLNCQKIFFFFSGWSNFSPKYILFLNEHCNLKKADFLFFSFNTVKSQPKKRVMWRFSISRRNILFSQKFTLEPYGDRFFFVIL